VETVVNEEMGASIFPNPASGSITVTIHAAAKNAVLLLMDINGKILQRVVTAKQNTVLNTTDYSEGIYLVKIVTGGQTYHRKLIIRR
jgi:myo-inositol-hexaphosphate 3-phosphohydrolase